MRETVHKGGERNPSGNPDPIGGSVSEKHLSTDTRKALQEKEEKEKRRKEFDRAFGSIITAVMVAEQGDVDKMRTRLEDARTLIAGTRPFGKDEEAYHTKLSSLPGMSEALVP